MKTMLVLIATEAGLEDIPFVYADIVLYLGEMNISNTPVINTILFNGKLNKENKDYLLNKIAIRYEVDIFFIEANDALDISDNTIVILPFVVHNYSQSARRKMCLTRLLDDSSE